MDETYLDYNGLLRYHELIQKLLPTEMSASGTNHKGGLVPDPGATAGTSKFLREDGTWLLPPNTTYESKAAASGGTALSLVTTGEKATWNNKSDFSGSYNDLTDKPTIPDALIQADWNLTTTTAKDYIKNKPTIPAALVNADWNANSGVSQILNKPTTATTSTDGLMSAADKQKLDGITSGATANAGTVTGITIGTGGTNYTPTNGVVTIPAYPTVTTYYAPTTTGTSGQVWMSNGSGGEWGTVSTTPAYSNVTYTVYVPSSNSSGALTLNFNNGPVQVYTLSANVSSISTSNIPAGHSLHVIFRSSSTSSTRTVAIAHNSSTSCCPEGSALSLTVPKQGSGYTEVDFLNANNIIYVRGV